MTCLSETLCSTSNVFDLIYIATTAIDYAGTVFFGSRWESIGPDVAARAEMVQAFLTDFFAEPMSDCQRYAALGGLRG